MRYIFIIEGGARGCPLAHGDDPESDEDAADQFVTDAVNAQGRPYWSADD
jgi:hypothetical protein